MNSIKSVKSRNRVSMAKMETDKEIPEEIWNSTTSTGAFNCMGELWHF